MRKETEANESVNWAMQYAAAIGNLALGAAGTIYGSTNTMSVFSDGLHNLGDSLAYWLQGKSIREADTFTEDRLMRYRKAGHWTLFAGSVGAGIKSAYDVYDTWANGAPTPPASAAATAVGALSLGAAVTLGGISEYKIRQRVRRSGDTHRTADERAWTKHVFGMDIVSSGLAAVGSVAQHKFPAVEQALGVVSGVVGAYLFRPTHKNLSHDHASHKPGADGHAEHEHHGHGHGRHETSRRWRMSEKIKDGGRWLVSQTFAALSTSNLVKSEAQDDAVGKRLRSAIGVGAVALAGVAAVKVGYEISDLLPGSTEVAVPGPVQLPAAPEPVAPPSPANGFPAAALELSAGEGGHQLLAELGLPAEDRQDIWQQVGAQLGDLEYADGTDVAYLEDFGGEAPSEWRLNMSPDGQMSTQALELIMYQTTEQPVTGIT